MIDYYIHLYKLIISTCVEQTLRGRVSQIVAAFQSPDVGVSKGRNYIINSLHVFETIQSFEGQLMRLFPVDHVDPLNF